MSSLAVLQSGGPTSVLNASLVGIIREARNSFDRVVGVRNGFEGFLDKGIFDCSSISAEQLDRLERTPSAALGTSRFRPDDGQLEQILAALEELDCSGLIGIGGNDTSETLDRLARLAQERGDSLRVLGLPKTIDNDLAMTDHSLGYPSAARYIAAYARDAHVDTLGTSNLYAVKFIEVMGRNAGWLAAAASLWLPPDLPPAIIALPERPFDSQDVFLQTLQRQIDGHGWATVVVPETMRWSNGDHVAGPEPEWVDAFGHPYFPSAGHALVKVISQALGVRAKLERPGSVSRSSIDYASAIDLEEAVACGRHAVRAIDAGETGMCTVITRTSSNPYDSKIELAPLADIANVEYLIPDSMINESGIAPVDEFFNYAAPLVGSSTVEYEIIRWHRAG